MKDFIALTVTQVDEIIKLMPSLFALVGTLFGLISTIFGGLLLFFQQRNKKDLTNKITESTATTEAFRATAKDALDVANNTNSKIADFHETASSVIREIKELAPTKPANPQHVIIDNKAENPIPTKPV